MGAHIRRITVATISAAITLLAGACTHVPSPEEQYQSMFASTGFERGDDGYLHKTQGGYPLLLRFEMGDVYGRYAARVAMGEIGRELGGIFRFLTGSYEHVGTVVGSPLDQALSAAIGQPLSVIMILKHDKPGASRLDVLSEFSTVQPGDMLPKRERVGFTAGNLRSADERLAARVASDARLMESLSNFRSQYIRVDDRAVTFFFAGSEREYSGMIRNFGGYDRFVNAISDSLVALADKI